VQYLVNGQQSDEKAVLAGLMGLKGLVKKYEYEMEDERKPLYEIVEQTFGILGGLVNQVLSIENEKAYEIMYLISKIFYTANQLYVCPFFAGNPEALDPWIAFFKHLMDRPLPAELDSMVEDMDEIERRDKHICWKTKGIAAQTTYRMFSKYGNPKHAADAYVEFAKVFKSKYAISLLESHLQTVLRRQTNFIGSKALNFGIKFVSQSTKMAETMAKLKPFVEKLLFEVIVVPIMLITHRDITLFKDDPIEYVRK
jgi:importin-7